MVEEVRASVMYRDLLMLGGWRKNIKSMYVWLYIYIWQLRMQSE